MNEKNGKLLVLLKPFRETTWWLIIIVASPHNLHRQLITQEVMQQKFEYLS